MPVSCFAGTRRVGRGRSRCRADSELAGLDELDVRPALRAYRRRPPRGPVGPAHPRLPDHPGRGPASAWWRPCAGAFRCGWWKTSWRRAATAAELDRLALPRKNTLAYRRFPRQALGGAVGPPGPHPPGGPGGRGDLRRPGRRRTVGYGGRLGAGGRRPARFARHRGGRAAHGGPARPHRARHCADPGVAGRPCRLCRPFRRRGAAARTGAGSSPGLPIDLHDRASGPRSPRGARPPGPAPPDLLPDDYS